MSVTIGRPVRALIAPRIFKPSTRPGPRNERIDVRLALSYDALKTSGTRVRCAISASRSASMLACVSLSMTQGPATSTKGWPPPKAMWSPSWTGDTLVIIRGADDPRAALRRHRARRASVSRHGFGGRARDACGFVLVARGDERGEERMRPRRLRFELRMELHRDVPRVARDLGDLDELAIRRPARDPHAGLNELRLVQAVELVPMPVTFLNGRRVVDALRE